MLEPAIVTARVDRSRATSWREVFGQLDLLAAKLHSHNAHSDAEDALKVVVLVSRDFCFVDLLERQHVRIEFHRAVQIGDRHTDGRNRSHECCRPGLLPGNGLVENGGHQ